MLVPFSRVFGSSSCNWVMLHFFCCSECICTLIWESVFTFIQWNLSWMESRHKWNLSAPEKWFSPKDPNFKYLQVLLLYVTILERKRNLIPSRSVVGRFHCILTVEFLYEFSQNRFVFLFGSRTLGVWQFFSVLMECIPVCIVSRYLYQVY